MAFSFTRGRSQNVLAAILPLLLLAILLPLPAASAMTHRQAIELARAGKTTEALAWFQQYANDATPEIAWDYLSVLTWAGKDAEALTLLSRLPSENLPPYALDAAAKAARNLRRFGEAEALYRQGTERFPEQPSFLCGLVRTLVDSGQDAAALEQGHRLSERFPNDDEALLAAGYAEEAAGNHFAALRLYERILAQDSSQAEARRRRILVADALGAPFLATDLAAADAALFGADEWARLRSNRAAQAVRWGSLPPADEAAAFVETDQALALLEETLRRLDPASPVTHPYFQRVRIDRLVALRDRIRMADAVHAYEALQSDEAILPYYALVAAGDAYLHQQRPERARRLYEAALQQRPGDFKIRMSLFYALLEQQDFADARILVDRLAQEAPAFLPTTAGRERRPNPDKLEAEMAAALGLAWANDLPSAQDRFEAMLRKARGNPDLYREVGNVYSLRGWPRRAVEMYRQGLTLAPRHPGLRIGLAEALIALDEGAEAAPIVRELAVRSPEDLEIKRLRRAWDLRGKRQWFTEVRHADSSGEEFGSRELILDSVLYSQFFADRFRAFTRGYYAEASFPEGDEEFRRFGFGLEYRAAGVAAAGELTYNSEGGRDLGGKVSVVFEPDDHWSLAAGVEAFSRETPLRALRNGIEADAASLGIGYRANERRQLALELQIMDFSDGNFRRSLFGSFRQRLLTRPSLQVDGGLEVYASKNSRNDAPYFNPDEDLHAGVGFDAEWRPYHRPSFSFTHHLAGSGGRYWQKDFAADWTASFLYEHLWMFGEVFELGYGAGRNRRVFDGDPDYATLYHLRAQWRF